MPDGRAGLAIQEHLADGRGKKNAQPVQEMVAKSVVVQDLEEERLADRVEGSCQVSFISTRGAPS